MPPTAFDQVAEELARLERECAAIPASSSREIISAAAARLRRRLIIIQASRPATAAEARSESYRETLQMLRRIAQLQDGVRAVLGAVGSGRR